MQKTPFDKLNSSNEADVIKVSLADSRSAAAEKPGRGVPVSKLPIEAIQKLREGTLDPEELKKLMAEARQTGKTR